MNKSVKADVVSFVKHLSAAFKTIAKAEHIALSFTADQNIKLAIFHAPTLASDISAILNKVIEFTPEQEKLHISVQFVDEQKCKVVISNTGINLSLNYEITHSCKMSVKVTSLEKSTQFEIEIELAAMEIEPLEANRVNGPNYIPDYYDEIRKRLRSHFTKSDSLIEALERSNPREAAFLKKVNQLIISNMQNSQFDTNFLSVGLNMSRTQLFRRLKPIIRQSPGRYVRTVRLQMAKELFETTDLRISEVAYKTGFETASHFTKAFTQQYGIKPSLFCRKKDQVTNE